jgi:hypothetical protein
MTGRPFMTVFNINCGCLSSFMNEEVRFWKETTWWAFVCAFSVLIIEILVVLIGEAGGLGSLIGVWDGWVLPGK